MLAFVKSSFSLLILELGMRGALGTKSFPFDGMPSFAQPYQYFAQQPASLIQQQQQPLLSQAAQRQSLLSQSQSGLLSQPAQLPSLDQQSRDGLLQSTLGSLLQSSPQLSQQDLLQAPLLQQASLMQPRASTGMDDAALLANDQAQQAASLSMPQIQNMMASLPIQEVVKLMQSIESLQKRTQGLEKQLSDAHVHEKELNDVAYKAAYRSNNIDQSARKLASLAQASVNQAQKSVDQEKTMMENMKSHLVQVEKEKSELSKQKEELRMQLAQTRNSLRSFQQTQDASSLQQEFSAELSQRRPQATPASLAQQALRMRSRAAASLAQLDERMRLRAAPNTASYEPAMQETSPDSFVGAASEPTRPRTLIDQLRSDSGVWGNELAGSQPGRGSWMAA